MDDDSINLSVFGQFLPPYYEILITTAGQRALRLANGAPKPDPILLDVATFLPYWTLTMRWSPLARSLRTDALQTLLELKQKKDIA